MGPLQLAVSSVETVLLVNASPGKQQQLLCSGNVLHVDE
jgi:hypothetical protein